MWHEINVKLATMYKLVLAGTDKLVEYPIDSVHIAIMIHDLSLVCVGNYFIMCNLYSLCCVLCTSIYCCAEKWFEFSFADPTGEGAPGTRTSSRSLCIFYFQAVFGKKL